jgi:hypothetical protein
MLIKHFMRYKPGWWILHIIVVGLDIGLSSMGKKGLYTALVLLGVAALMLHFRIHFFMVPDPADPEVRVFSPALFLSNLFPLLDVVLVSAFFASRRTSVYGYLLNGIIVIYGTVFMAHFSIAELTARSAPLEDWIIKSTLPDIAIAWADFFVGKALYDLYQRT